MYRNRISEGLEDLKAGLDAFSGPIQIYAGTGRNQETGQEPSTKDLFKGVYEALKISGEASRIVWEEAKSEIRKRYTDATMKLFGLNPEFVGMLRKYGERKNLDK